MLCGRHRVAEKLRIFLHSRAVAFVLVMASARQARLYPELLLDLQRSMLRVLPRRFMLMVMSRSAGLLRDLRRSSWHRVPHKRPRRKPEVSPAKLRTSSAHVWAKACLAQVPAGQGRSLVLDIHYAQGTTQTLPTPRLPSTTRTASSRARTRRGWRSCRASACTSSASFESSARTSLCCRRTSEPRSAGRRCSSSSRHSWRHRSGRCRGISTSRRPCKGSFPSRRSPPQALHVSAPGSQLSVVQGLGESKYQEEEKTRNRRQLMSPTGGRGIALGAKGLEVLPSVRTSSSLSSRTSMPSTWGACGSLCALGPSSCALAVACGHGGGGRHEESRAQHRGPFEAQQRPRCERFGPWLARWLEELGRATSLLRRGPLGGRLARAVVAAGGAWAAVSARALDMGTDGQRDQRLRACLCRPAPLSTAPLLRRRDLAAQLGESSFAIA